MALIPEHLWAQLTVEEQTAIQDTMKGLRRRGRVITCPHCAGEVHIMVDMVARKPQDDANTSPTPPQIPKRTEIDARFLEAAGASGLLTAFEEAIREERALAGIPTDIPGFFLTFWSLAEPVKIPMIAKASWQMEFDAPVESYGANGIVAILAGGQLRAFVPNRFLHVARAALIPGGGRRPAISTAPLLERWVKGRFGYVPAEGGAFGQQMKQRSKGGFGRIVQ